MNIAMLLQMAADAFADRPALMSQGSTYTYRQLFNASNVAADLFRSSGAEFVATLDETSAASPIALVGAAIAGIPYVPLNYRLTEEQLNKQLERIAPAYLVANEENFKFYGDKAGLNSITRQKFLESVKSNSPLNEPWPEDPTAIAVQLFTSGTTGEPKAAILRHEHLMSYILGSVEFMSAEESSATLVSVPPYHIAGISALLSSIYSCRRIVVLPDFNPAAWLALASQESVTNAFVVPTMLSRIVYHLETIEQGPNLPDLKAIAYGGGKMPAPVIERALALFPEVEFANAYALPKHHQP